MAEAANVRQNLQNVPSIFEISAAETLDNLIYPALSKVFDYFGLHLDFKLWGNIHLREEFSPIITWILQYLYLQNRASSFGESFYGLQRTDTKTGELLTPPQRLASSLLLTLLPYAERKLKARSAQHKNTSSWEHYLLNIFHVYNASKTVNTFLYLIKFSSGHSPIFRAMNLTLRYPIEQPKEDKVTYLFLKALEVLAFFLQFIQWWYSNDQRRKGVGALKTPEPIKDTATTKELKKQLPATGKCPVCLMNIQTPTACAVSGYVFCWKCIMYYLKEKGTCPVTEYPISLDDLVRIYE